MVDVAWSDDIVAAAPFGFGVRGRCGREEGGGVRSVRRRFRDRRMPSGSIREAGLGWLRDFFPGYFAMAKGTGIVAVAARLLGREVLACPCSPST